MTKPTKFFLVTAIVCLVPGFLFTVGVVDVGKAVGLYLALPVGAILLGLFMISLMFEKETARFDEEQRFKRISPASTKSAQRLNTEENFDSHTQLADVH